MWLHAGASQHTNNTAELLGGCACSLFLSWTFVSDGTWRKELPRTTEFWWPLFRVYCHYVFERNTLNSVKRDMMLRLYKKSDDTNKPTQKIRKKRKGPSNYSRSNLPSNFQPVARVPSTIFLNTVLCRALKEFLDTMRDIRHQSDPICCWALAGTEAASDRAHHRLSRSTATIDDWNKKTYCLNSIERIEEKWRSSAMDMKSHKSAILGFTKQLGATDNT